jgi:hypothetical protein
LLVNSVVHQHGKIPSRLYQNTTPTNGHATAMGIVLLQDHTTTELPGSLLSINV